MAEEEKNVRSDAAAIDATVPLARSDPTLASPSSGPTARAEPSSPSFAPAELIAERYRIVRLIGEGGMGEVYEAEDLLLRERLALKTIRADVARDEKVVERFKREIQLARRVTHANVCRIFDVGLHRRAAFLTMELLDGETLSARIARRGRLPPAEAAPIVGQVAAALTAAHKAGVVHRDLKPGNVILCEDGARAVVTDFGLARNSVQTPADPMVTGDGGVVGSPSYMAPEQVEGREITAAADIYALGVVMYEMVTGRLPFIGATPLATAVMRLSEAPVTPCAHVTGLEPAWERAILACLARDPAARPPSARAVAEMIEGRRPRSGWRRAAVPLLAGAVVLGVGIALLARPGASARPAASAPARVEVGGRRSVAVLGFKNLTGRGDASWISGALAEMIATELAASNGVRLVPGESVARAKRELGVGEEVSFAPDTLGRLRNLLDTDYVLTGSYMALGREAGSRIRFDLKLQDTRTGETVAAMTQTGGEADLMELVASTGEALRGQLALGELSPREREGVRASQPKPDVARLYAEGLAQLRVEACAAARGPLEQAVAADPQYPQAHSALAEALACLGYQDRALDEARRAVDLSQHLPEQVRLATQARLYELGKEPEKAIDVYATLFGRFPDNFDYGYRLAALQLYHLREEDFGKTLAALRKLPPPAGDNPRIDLLEAIELFFGGKSDDALRIVRAAQARAEDQGARLVAAGAELTAARILRHLGRRDDALAAVGRARAVFEAAGDQDGVAATVTFEAGLRDGEQDGEFRQKAEEQVAGIARALRNPKEMLRFKLVLGARYAEKGDLGAAVRAYRDGLEIARAQKDAGLEAQVGVQLIIVLMERDLPAARKLADELLVAAREAPEDLRCWVALLRVSVENEQGETAAARRDADATLRDARSGPARSWALLTKAALDNDARNYQEAEQLARAVLDGSALLAPMAHLTLAESLIGQRRFADADAMIKGIGNSPLMRSPQIDFLVAGMADRVKAETDLADARRDLEDKIAKARALGFVSSVFELQLRLGHVELARGDRHKGQNLLASVANEARRAGYVRIADKATRPE